MLYFTRTPINTFLVVMLISDLMKENIGTRTTNKILFLKIQAHVEFNIS